MKLSSTQKRLRVVLILAAACAGFAAAEAAEQAPLRGVAGLNLSQLSLPDLTGAPSAK